MARRAAKQKNVNVAKSIYHRLLMKNVFSFIGYMLLAALLIYLVLAATIIRFVPSTSMGMTLVKNTTYKGDVAPIGQLLYVSDKEQKYDPISNLKRAFIPSGKSCIATVLAGPYGSIEWSEKATSIEGKFLPLNLETEPEQEYLENQYVVRGLKGDCQTKYAFIINKNNIVGIPALYSTEDFPNINIAEEPVEDKPKKPTKKAPVKKAEPAVEESIVVEEPTVTDTPESVEPPVEDTQPVTPEIVETTPVDTPEPAVTEEPEPVKPVEPKPEAPKATAAPAPEPKKNRNVNPADPSMADRNVGEDNTSDKSESGKVVIGS